MSKIEILSPAGGFDSVVAAVRCGADAVYVGAKVFSARASAHNFDDQELRECVRYCHQRGVKVYLALNTLIFDDEMDEALALAIKAARADIDAIIIQDMGLVSLLQKAVPGLPLHASTQMTVHTPYGARALYEMGFKRVVVSRELSFSEIKEIKEFCPEVELEVFVHGALCMCVSGQCYFSSMLGGRSANRGMCAQPCRLTMSCRGNDHALSLKDNGSLGWMKKLEELGVASAKIEGRMKRPEYVAAATSAAKEARDKGFVSKESEDRLRSVFSRTGFTDGYLAGERGEAMFGYRRKDDVVSADSRLLKEIRQTYKDEARTVGVEMYFSATAGEKPRLVVSDGTHTVAAVGENIAEQAVNRPLDRERARQNLSKTGGTQYAVTKFSAEIGGEIAISAAELNAMRRSALEQLDEERAVWHHYEIREVRLSSVTLRATPSPRGEGSCDRVCVRIEDYPEEAKRLGRVFVALDGIESEESNSVCGIAASSAEHKFSQMPRNDCVFSFGIEAPRVCFGNETEVYEKLRRLKEQGAEHLIVHNIGTAYIGRQLGYVLHGGYGLNIVNSRALQWAREYGFADMELSPEIDLRRIEKLKKTIPVGMIRYGYLPLMITRNAPGGISYPSCKNNDFLQDRKNERFPVIHREGYHEIVNCVPILMPQEEYKAMDGVFNVFHFTVENSVEKMKKTLEKLRENHGFERITHGLYSRGVKNITI
jgi:putative protease